jgi:hypothetical protein
MELVEHVAMLQENGLPMVLIGKRPLESSDLLGTAQQEPLAVLEALRSQKWALIPSLLPSGPGLVDPAATPRPSLEPRGLPPEFEDLRLRERQPAASQDPDNFPMASPDADQSLSPEAAAIGDEPVDVCLNEVENADIWILAIAMYLMSTTSDESLRKIRESDDFPILGP